MVNAIAKAPDDAEGISVRARSHPSRSEKCGMMISPFSKLTK
ncbi:MAG: hypothetical protein R3C26_09280 [Calditrichia bacterium]